MKRICVFVLACLTVMCFSTVLIAASWEEFASDKTAVYSFDKSSIRHNKEKVKTGSFFNKEKHMVKTLSVWQKAVFKKTSKEYTTDGMSHAVYQMTFRIIDDGEVEFRNERMSIYDKNGKVMYEENNSGNFEPVPPDTVADRLFKSAKKTFLLW